MKGRRRLLPQIKEKMSTFIFTFINAVASASLSVYSLLAAFFSKKAVATPDKSKFPVFTFFSSA